MTWGWHGFKKGNNFPLSTPTVRRKDVKMLRTQVEPRAASKCGFTQVWHRFKHFHWLSIYSWQECRFSTNQRARNRSVTGETLIGPYRPLEMMSKCSKLKCSTNRRRVSSKCTSTFQLTSVNSQGLYQNWSKFPRFLPKLLSRVLIDFQSPDFIDWQFIFRFQLFYSRKFFRFSLSCGKPLDTKDYSLGSIISSISLF